jgi:hypothetical protein
MRKLKLFLSKSLAKTLAKCKIMLECETALLNKATFFRLVVLRRARDGG